MKILLISFIDPKREKELFFEKKISKHTPNLINFLGFFLYSLGSFFFLFGKIGKAINYSQVPHYKNKSKDWLIRCGVMVTFDYFSPKYDSPIRPSIMKKISKKHLNPKNIDFEVYTDKGTTLLRSLA